ncbi:hypothetical protein BBR47_47690 [Brevibacillus brevis NBRC 100599]|uniref:Transposase n=1 Tax=Brevibacillus brevis (strain 47 / JCM 6285 / NBRC 100599) TaxID=358681 RepID=C0ZKR9_BREBN|nr:hypothetical protein BBR47_47690 [Brevibacillus brevis NBRC 100599]
MCKNTVEEAFSVLKKRAKRTPIGRRQADSEYPRLTFN